MTEQMLDRMVEAWSDADAHHAVRDTCRDLLDAALQGSAALPSEASEFKSGSGWITTASHTVSQYMLDRKIEECTDADTIRLLQAFKETIGHFCGDAA